MNVFLCMYIYTHVCIYRHIYVHVRTYVGCFRRENVFLLVANFEAPYQYLNAYMFVCIYMLKYVLLLRICLCVCIYIYICMYVHTYIHTWIYVCRLFQENLVNEFMHTYAYIHTYTHVHTHSHILVDTYDLTSITTCTRTHIHTTYTEQNSLVVCELQCTSGGCWYWRRRSRRHTCRSSRFAHSWHSTVHSVHIMCVSGE
jgi:hypothetical protein